jgi:putative zinc finger/helix-turn-helix YgiT family protein
MYHIKIDRLKTPKCKRCGQVAPDSEANEQITRAFLKNAKLLTPEQIQSNREALGLTQEDLASALGVADAAVARWEDGIQIQTRSLDNMLRLFFGLPAARELLTKRKLEKIGLVLRDKSLAST